jgi:hypothetical protein
MTQQDSRHATSRPDSRRTRVGTSADRARFWAGLNRRDPEAESTQPPEHAPPQDPTAPAGHRRRDQSTSRGADTDSSDA